MTKDELDKLRADVEKVGLVGPTEVQEILGIPHRSHMATERRRPDFPPPLKATRLVDRDLSGDRTIAAAPVWLLPDIKAYAKRRVRRQRAQYSTARRRKAIEDARRSADADA